MSRSCSKPSSDFPLYLEKKSKVFILVYKIFYDLAPALILLYMLFSSLCTHTSHQACSLLSGSLQFSYLFACNFLLLMFAWLCFWTSCRSVLRYHFTEGSLLHPKYSTFTLVTHLSFCGLFLITYHLIQYKCFHLYVYCFISHY